MVMISEPNVPNIFEIFETAGFGIRLVGGCVRDLIMGNEPKDYDFATTATPAQIIEVLDKNKIRHIEPGLSHGTVSAIIDREMYEITTLRIDVDTDGRHAEVEFTQDWRLDAQRRDFTINAMSIDSEGEIYDYHGGQRDIENGLMEFVGDAKGRIEEDYLRILRMFRFAVRFNFRLQPYELTLVRKYMPEMWEKVSRERITSELSKIFEIAEKTGDFKVIQAMESCEVFSTGKMKLIWPFIQNRSRREPIWAAFCSDHNEVDWIATFMKLDNATKKYMHAVLSMRDYSGIDSYDFVHMHYIAKISMEHIRRCFPDYPEIDKIDTAVPVKILTKTLIDRGLTGVELGEAIKAEIAARVSGFQFISHYRKF